MSRTRAEKTRIALLVGAVFCLIFFLMEAFPTSPNDYLGQGTDVWVVPGHHGQIGLVTGAETIGNHWSGTVTLTIHRSGGEADIVGTATSKEDWGNSITSKGKHNLLVYVDATIPRDIQVGTTLAGLLTGEVTTPQYSHGGFNDVSTTVRKTLTVHIVTRGTLNRQWAQKYKLPSGLPEWILLVPISIFAMLGAWHVQERARRRHRVRR